MIPTADYRFACHLLYRGIYAAVELLSQSPENAPAAVALLKSALLKAEKYCVKKPAKGREDQ